MCTGSVCAPRPCMPGSSTSVLSWTRGCRTHSHTWGGDSHALGHSSRESNRRPCLYSHPCTGTALYAPALRSDGTCCSVPGLAQPSPSQRAGRRGSRRGNKTSEACGCAQSLRHRSCSRVQSRSPSHLLQIGDLEAVSQGVTSTLRGAFILPHSKPARLKAPGSKRFISSRDSGLNLRSNWSAANLSADSPPLRRSAARVGPMATS